MNAQGQTVLGAKIPHSQPHPSVPKLKSLVVSPPIIEQVVDPDAAPLRLAELRLPVHQWTPSQVRRYNKYPKPISSTALFDMTHAIVIDFYDKKYVQGITKEALQQHIILQAGDPERIGHLFGIATHLSQACGTRAKEDKESSTSDDRLFFKPGTNVVRPIKHQYLREEASFRMLSNHIRNAGEQMLPYDIFTWAKPFLTEWADWNRLELNRFLLRRYYKACGYAKASEPEIARIMKSRLLNCLGENHLFGQDMKYKYFGYLVSYQLRSHLNLPILGEVTPNCHKSPECPCPSGGDIQGACHSKGYTITNYAEWHENGLIQLEAEAGYKIQGHLASTRCIEKSAARRTAKDEPLFYFGVSFGPGFKDVLNTTELMETVKDFPHF
jgi:hypothetical protein